MRIWRLVSRVLLLDLCLAMVVGASHHDIMQVVGPVGRDPLKLRRATLVVASDAGSLPGMSNAGAEALKP